MNLWLCGCKLHWFSAYPRGHLHATPPTEVSLESREPSTVSIWPLGAVPSVDLRRPMLPVIPGTV